MIQFHVPSKQLRLFPSANPLLDRFGEAYFREAPRSPGVYTMSGDQDRLEDFFNYGPVALREFQERTGSRQTPVPPEDMDPTAEPAPPGWFRDRAAPPDGQGEFFTED